MIRVALCDDHALIRRGIRDAYQRVHDYERLMQLNYVAAVRLTLALLP